MGYFEVNKISLKVLTNEGFKISSGIVKNETQLLYDDYFLNAPTFFFNAGNTGIDFEINIILKENDYYKGKHISEYLNTWDKYNTPVTIVTNAMDIPNGKYLLTVKNKKQTSKKYSIWQLRFKQYYENSQSFETEGVKNSSLSSIDQTLMKYSLINENSPSEAIYALQVKLKEKGCFKNKYNIWIGNSIQPLLDDEGKIVPRIPNGKWDDDMVYDIFGFQSLKGLESKQGKCDWETITTLISDTIPGEHWWGEMLL